MPEWFRASVAWTVGAAILTLILLVIFFSQFFVFVDNYQLGYKFDTLSGKITVLDRTGWFAKRPFVDTINVVDLRPMQVCINANSRVLNCKLVKFNPTGLALFISWHGRKSYSIDYDNASENNGYRTTNSQGSLNDILMSYAYDGTGRAYPFLTVMRDLKNDDAAVSLPISVVKP